MNEFDTNEEEKRPSAITPGDPVLDIEDSDPSSGVVILRPDATIAEWTTDIDGEEVTIAETNPEYDPDEPVAIIAFERILDEYWPEWRDASPEELFDGVCANSVKFYSFPASRLEHDPTRVPFEQREAEPETEAESDPTDSTGDSSPEREESNTERKSASDEEEPSEGEGEAEWEPPTWLDTLEEEISGTTTTAVDDEREALCVEKLGETYYVHADGSIEGEGALRSQLEARVDNIRKK